MKRLIPLLLLLTSAAPVAAQSMFSDFRARTAGDVITIILSERTSASRASEWQNSAANGIGGGAGVTGGSDLSGKFALDAKFSKDAQSRNSSLQKDLLSGTMTATIVDVNPAGNLLLAGERKLTVNGETHLMKVSGTVRRFDIQPNNTILSWQLADADISYKKAGGLTRGFFKPGKVARLGVIAMIGGAIAFAMK